jgi:branched-subunit amino acid aminotransferase/4-amino-4-deoxychorismate lyase
MICYNGKFHEVMPEMVSPLFDCCQFGALVFETMRTYEETNIFKLEEHLDRLWKSAELLEIIFLQEKEELKNNIKKLVEINKIRKKDLRIKVFLCSDFYAITTTPLEELPDDFYDKGILVAEATFERNFANVKYANPAYKYFMSRQPKTCFETIFFNNQGLLREGNISNVFAIINGVLVTPKKDILHGVTRTQVLKVAQNLNIKTEEREVSKKELLLADEIFITNSTKEVIPVCKWNKWTNNKFKIAHLLRQKFHLY